MAILSVVKYGDPILRKKVRNVENFKNLKTLIDDMFETMYHEQGIGLAANQIGIDKNILVGREINQNLSRGQIIKVRHLKERFTVVEGQAIIIYADLDGINVKMDGNALQNGHLNEWIKVRNNSSGKVVEGKIINEKKILINF